MPEPTDPKPNVERPPELSVVLITPDSFETLRRTVGCLVRQTARERIELVIIAPASARIDVDRTLVAPLAGVQVVRLESLTPTGPARAAAIHAARAPVVAFGEEHCFPEPAWAQALIDAHRDAYVAVGPAVTNAKATTNAVTEKRIAIRSLATNVRCQRRLGVGQAPRGPPDRLQ